MNKKGLFFTVTAVVLISILIITFVLTTQNRTQDIIEINSLRVETANSFVNFLDDTQFERALSTSTTYALSSFSSYIEENKVYLQEDVTLALTKAVLGISCDRVVYDIDFINRKPDECFLDNNYNKYMSPEGLSDQTLPGILNDIKNLALSSGLDFSYKINSISFALDNHWEILADINLNYELNNTDNTISFKKEDIMATTRISIVNQRDPVYVKNGIDKIIKNVDKAEINEVLPWRFVTSNNAPNYFQRLAGNLNNNGPFGIQSVFNPSAYGVGILKDDSYVDVYYFTGDNRQVVCKRVNNIYIKLQESEINFYKNLGVDLKDCGSEFLDCTGENGWRNAQPLNCGIVCTTLTEPLLQVRYCGQASNPNLETRCVADSRGNTANACKTNCENPNHCGDGILNKVCEECEPGPGVNCNPSTCKLF